MGRFKETVTPNSSGRVPSESSQVLIFVCMGKSARFGYWLANVHACQQKFEKMASGGATKNN